MSGSDTASTRGISGLTTVGTLNLYEGFRTCLYCGCCFISGLCSARAASTPSISFGNTLSTRSTRYSQYTDYTQDCEFRYTWEHLVEFLSSVVQWCGPASNIEKWRRVGAYGRGGAVAHRKPEEEPKTENLEYWCILVLL